MALQTNTEALQANKMRHLALGDSQKGLGPYLSDRRERLQQRKDSM